MATADKLTQLNQVKTDIKNSLSNVVDSMENVAFTGYAGKIDEVKSEVDNQASLISQIVAALQGKAIEGGGSSGDGVAIEKYFYNGVLLPKLPAIEGYPYQMIMMTKYDDDSFGYGCQYTKHQLYKNSELAMKDTWNIYQSTEDDSVMIGYDTNNDSWDESTSNIIVPFVGMVSYLPEYFMFPIWTNNDILDGSADATEIYLAASEPVSEIDMRFNNHYYYRGVLLPKIPVYADYPIQTIVVAGIGNAGFDSGIGVLHTKHQLYRASEPYLGEVYSLWQMEKDTYITNSYNYDTNSWDSEQIADSTDDLGSIAVGTWEDAVCLRILWTNTDILDGSADSTDVYAYASDAPVPFVK